MSQQKKSRRIITACAVLLIAALLIVSLFVCAILRACSQVGKPRPSGPSPLITSSATVSGEGTLIFQSSRDGNSEIYRVQADGTGLTNLTQDPGDDTQAAWSPDGKQIAFISDRSGQESLYVMNADGSNPRRLYGLEDYGLEDIGSSIASIDGRRIARPAWSPDGKWIALSPGVIINIDGSGEPMTPSEDELCWNPVWSPDGAQIACDGVSVRDVVFTGGNARLARRTGSFGTRQFNQSPVWSPDGTRIAFLGHNGYMNSRGSTTICTVNPDLSGSLRLSDGRYGKPPAWSPDGTKIAYVDKQCPSFLECGSLEIRVVNADGTGEIQLTYNNFEERGLAWSPDSTRIAFTAVEVIGIFIINADGSAQTILAAPAVYDGGLSWQPNP